MNHVALHLPRCVAQELVLASVLAPFMVSNLGARFDKYIYVSDASEAEGAFCKAEVSEEVQQILFRSCRSKGAYTRLLVRHFLQR